MFVGQLNFSRLSQLRISLMVRIDGSHPSDPGSIPGCGIFLAFLCTCTCSRGLELSFGLVIRSWGAREGNEKDV